jgi:glutamate dehydrogenase (NAD(P)+)
MKTVCWNGNQPLGGKSARFKLAAQKLNLDEGLWKVLQHPNRELIVHSSLAGQRKARGLYQFRVQRSIARGPPKAGSVTAPMSHSTKFEPSPRG